MAPSLSDSFGNAGPALEAAGALRDGELALEVARLYRPDDSPWGVAAIRFRMLVGVDEVGSISLRLGTNDRIRLYAGHIGFEVEPAWRGRRFALRATRLLLPMAARLGLDPLWLTCRPDNLASRRTIERLGAVYENTVAIPEDYDAYRRGERWKCRYRLAVSQEEL